MENAGSGFGLKCPNCKTSIDVYGTVGADPQLCPNCGTKMIPNESAKITTQITCKNCNSSFGIINSDTCPICGKPF